MTDIQFTDALLKEISQIDFTELFKEYNELSQKQFLARDLGLSGRKYQQLKELNITPPAQKEIESDGKREWVKLNFFEFIWLKMVISLRKLGYPYSDIKKARDVLFETVDLDPRRNITKDNPDIVKHLIDFFAKNTLNEESKALVAKFVDDPILLTKVKNVYSNRRQLLEILIFDAIANKNMEVGIGFFEGGECIPFNWNMIVMFENWHPNVKKEDVLNNTIRRPHLYISLSKYIIDFISESEAEQRSLAFSMLSDEELMILRELRNKDYKNITINYDKGTESRIIKTEKEKKIKESEVKDFIKQVLFAPNCKISYTATKKGDLIINTIMTKKLNK
jgi:hypothetical protein